MRIMKEQNIVTENKKRGVITLISFRPFKNTGRRRGCQRMRWLDGIKNTMDMNLGKLQEMVRGKEGHGLRAAVHGVTKNWTRQGDRTTTKILICKK